MADKGKSRGARDQPGDPVGRLGDAAVADVAHALSRSSCCRWSASSSLLQETALRVAGDAGFAAPLIIANEEHRFIIAEQLREIGVAPHALLLEPVGRNTAPAACVAALRLAEREPDALMLVMPSDHAIDDVPAFHGAIARAAQAAHAGFLVTFGVTPERAETGYGYIERGKKLPAADTRRFEPEPTSPSSAGYQLPPRPGQDPARVRPELHGLYLHRP